MLVQYCHMQVAGKPQGTSKSPCRCSAGVTLSSLDIAWFLMRVDYITEANSLAPNAEETHLPTCPDE